MRSSLLTRFYQIEDRHWWFVGRRQIVFDQLARYAPPGPLLDVGCGTGGTMAHLEWDAQVVGIDASAEALSCCRQRGLNVAMASGLALPFPDDAFAAALVLDVIEHVDDDVGLLTEVRRVLRPDGVAVLTVPALPALWSAHDEVNDHRRRYVKKALLSAIRGSGLEPLKATYYNSFLLPLAAARKLLVRNGTSEYHLEDLPGPVNATLRTVLTAEKSVIRHTNFPLGASLIAVCRRPISSPIVVGL